MKNASRSAVIVVFLLLLVGFATYVWPTRYRWDDFGGLPVRIDRFNGKTEILSYEGWRMVPERAPQR